MKRKERGFLILSGIVSLASQLPSCKSTTPGSNVESVSQSGAIQSCKGGTVEDSQACREILEIVKGYNNVNVNTIKIVGDSAVSITVASSKDGDALRTRFTRDIANFKVDAQQNLCYMKDQMANNKGGKCGSLDKATQIEIVVLGNNK